MDETSENQQPEIPCHEVLYRAALNKRHITPDGQVQVDLFLLRPDDEGMLSVFRKELVSLAVVKAQFNKPKAFVTLHAGRVRDAGKVLGQSVDVVPDEIPQIPGHAVIIGLPDNVQEPAKAEYAASLLRDQCRLITALSREEMEAIVKDFDRKIEGLKRIDPTPDWHVSMGYYIREREKMVNHLKQTEGTV
jgi:hypothetical protein